MQTIKRLPSSFLISGSCFEPRLIRYAATDCVIYVPIGSAIALLAGYVDASVVSVPYVHVHLESTHVCWRTTCKHCGRVAIQSSPKPNLSKL